VLSRHLVCVDRRGEEERRERSRSRKEVRHFPLLADALDLKGRERKKGKKEGGGEGSRESRGRKRSEYYEVAALSNISTPWKPARQLEKGGRKKRGGKGRGH